MTALWDAATAHAIGAAWLRDAIAPAGAFGRRARARERPFRPGDESAARAALARVAALAERVPADRLAALRSAIARAPDLGALWARATGGGTLDDVDFFEVGRLLDALLDVATLLHGDASEASPENVLEDTAIAALRAALLPGRTTACGFYLASSFDPTLAHERAAAAAAHAGYDAARSRLNVRVAAYAGIERIRDGEFVLMRDALGATLPPEIRVVREAPTYLLCEVALDTDALAALARSDAAAARVAAAEEGVRERLSRSVAGAAHSVERACDALGELDALVARAQFTRRYACVVPEITAGSGSAFVDARYLPLCETLAAHGRRYASLSLDLCGLGVVTGPNMGGKTAALRTLGFLNACLALGVPVPAASARIALVDEIVWLGIGAGDGADDGLLSAFGREVVALRGFLERDPGRALVLVDEFARTTSPREGRALLVALLERLRERGASGLAATHLAGIAASAGVAHYAVGGLRGAPSDDPLPPPGGAPLTLDAALARIAQTMDYRLARVDEDAVPAADALKLARALGLDARLVDRALAALGDARSPR